MREASLSIYGWLDKLEKESKRIRFLAMIFPIFILITWIGITTILIILYLYFVIPFEINTILRLSRSVIAQVVFVSIFFFFSAVLAYLIILYIKKLARNLLKKIGFAAKSISTEFSVDYALVFTFTLILSLIIFFQLPIDDLFVTIYTFLINLFFPVFNILPIFFVFLAIFISSFIIGFIFYYPVAFLIVKFIEKNPSDFIENLINSREIDLENLKEKDVFNNFDAIRIAYGISPNEVKLKVLDWPIINAFVVSSANSHTIFITRGAIEKLDKYELQALFSHEFSHISNKDSPHVTRINILGNFSFLFAWALVAIIAPALFNAALEAGRNKRKINLLLIFMAIAAWITGILFMLITPKFYSKLIKLYQKRRELNSDIESIKVTKYPDGMISLLVKVGKESTREFIAKNNIPQSFQSLFFDSEIETHPKVWERIEVIKSFVPGISLPQEYYEFKSKNI